MKHREPIAEQRAVTEAVENLGRWWRKHKAPPTKACENVMRTVIMGLVLADYNAEIIERGAQRVIDDMPHFFTGAPPQS